MIVQAPNPPAIAGRKVGPWLVALVVVVPTFMEILDTSIANVALRYIAGGLSASVNDSDWVITSYLAANATILPITGWLSAYLGRRNYFLISIAVFTAASALCGMATSLEQLIFFRVVQGLAGGGLQPSSQGVLIDTFPPERQNVAMTVFAIAGLLAPVVGPTLGGYITVFYEWRWIFYINIPVGIAAFVACYFILEDPDYLKQQRATLLSKPFHFDYIGLGLLALVVACWEVLLSKGQEWDWYNDPSWRVQAMAITFVVGLVLLYRREMSIESPVVDFRPLFDRNFTSSSVIIFFAFSVLYGCTVTLPNLLQTLYGYDAYVSGLVMSPSGLGSVMMLLVSGTLLGKGVDARKLILVGLTLMAGSLYWMAQMNLEIAPSQVIWPRFVTFMGISLLFAPLNLSALSNIPKEMRGGAVGLYALLRNEGGSMGTSLSKIFEERREQFHLSRTGEFLDPLNPAVRSFANQGRAFFLRQTGDPPGSVQRTWQLLADARQHQAASLAFFDVFLLYAAISLALIPLVILMRRSVAAKGAHISAE